MRYQPEDDSQARRPLGFSASSPRLFADAMLGALARWLRILDFDTAYDPALDDPALVAFSNAEGRTILTRDRRLTERRQASNHLLIRSGVVDEQVRQVLAELGLRPDPARLLHRCLCCNTPLAPLDAAAARARVPPWVARTQTEFRACPGCGRVYWRGTHVRRMTERLAAMRVEPAR
ncbi:MAG TPA: Mut7-C RNAse domain-containing protein [Thermoanaerobaculia bacterium]|nr:Mut7-C RNAse domain-containing protein [Thermoanaerobaculia bacterium]